MRHTNKFMSGMLSSVLTFGLTTTPASPATAATATEAGAAVVPVKDGGSDEDAEPPDTSRPAPRVHVPATASLAIEAALVKVTPAPEPAPPEPAAPEPVQFTGDAATWENGRLPEHALCPIEHAPRHAARCDAAAATERLNAAFRATFGRNLAITDSYRTLEQQVAVKAAKGQMAAPPGTSNHGWGIALDLGGGIETFGTVEHDWMRANAGTFGWIHPDWAQAHGIKPEPWHWEYKTGE